MSPLSLNKYDDHTAGIYVHIPFCRYRCHFCAFYVELHRPQLAINFIQALCREIDLQADRGHFRPERITSVYLGGGTPTALPPSALSQILHQIRKAFPIEPDAEITVEASFDSVSEPILAQLKQAGFTRISFGLEAVDASQLHRLGRPSLTKDITSLLDTTRRAGFTDINLDLMYGLPAQSLPSWQESVEATLAAHPAHVSTYALTIEEGTPFHQTLSDGTLALPDESLVLEMADAAHARLTSAGFVHYELSNYARPAHLSRHNMHYWTDHDVLGLGPSAHSHLGAYRFSNIPDVGLYASAVATGFLPIAESAHLTANEAARDQLIFGLRLTGGIPSPLISRDGMPPDIFETIHSLETQDLLITQQGFLRLTEKGRRLADTVASKLSSLYL
jgi:oxygen-independent coproporphyrinogen-3 oxidase